MHSAAEATPVDRADVVIDGIGADLDSLNFAAITTSLDHGQPWFDVDLSTGRALHSAHHAAAEMLVRRGLYEDAGAVLPRQPPSTAPIARRTRWAVTAAAIQYWGAGDVEAADRVLGDVRRGLRPVRPV